MATKEQIKRIYGLGAGLGIVGKDKDDMLHELIFSITGKDSVKQLDDSEFKAVQAELINPKSMSKRICFLIKNRSAVSYDFLCKLIQPGFYQLLQIRILL